ncbi:hypothetical protein BDQ12DRAFT_197218 [Crucibulum laeve]|uniref:Uncharacterized protein n=1 Tax=Crucibulum laeve TaxID=68775 RepID=A0A5C3MEH0_9AGAR|nr:hypothetical protein BDQ12DRAFT_197218 [Crucibulum laeve]
MTGTTPDSKPKAPTPPPPTYADVVAGASPTSQRAPSPQAQGQSTPAPAPNAPYPNPNPALASANHHPSFGPTPISHSQPLLPYAYYGPAGAAASRARWRFLGALFWGVAIYCLLGMLVGVEFWAEDASGRGRLRLRRWMQGGAIE